MSTAVVPNTAADGTQAKSRMVHSCNFRYAGRLSNENARALTSLHDRFALQISNSLQMYLGGTLRLRLVSLEQKSIRDYTAEMGGSNFLVPCALNVLNSSLLMQMDTSLVFPMIDLLLGGSGAPSEAAREMTDIDEEIMETVTSLIVKEIERTWHTLDLSLSPGHSIKYTAVSQIFPANEKLVLLMFELEVGATTGAFVIVLPTSFVGFLLRHLKTTQAKKFSAVRHTSGRGLKDRMLDCKFTIAADMPEMRVAVRDLIGLKPGAVLRLNTPVKTIGKLTVENTPIFEASPVRSGALKASQVVNRLHEPQISKE